MSTKNLARTVIEGGRYRYNKFLRRHSNAVARSHAHQVEHALSSGKDADDALFYPRKHVSRDFYDKLGPARRWLRSQVGRPWNKVRSELFARFDARTTPGRHILFDHLLKEVLVGSSAYRVFSVSPHGVLRYREHRRKRRRTGTT